MTTHDDRYVLRPVSAPQHVAVACPVPGCGEVLSIPITWRQAFHPDTAHPQVRTDALTEHLLRAHPATWTSAGATVEGPVHHDGADFQCSRRKVGSRAVLWAFDADARCPVCRPQVEAAA